MELDDLASTAVPGSIQSSPGCWSALPDPDLTSELEGDDDMLHALPFSYEKKVLETATRVPCQIRDQIEHYFSLECISHDLFLRSRMDPFGWVRIQEVLDFSNMRSLGVSLADVAAALRGSKTVQVSWDQQRVRPRSFLLRAAFVPRHNFEPTGEVSPATPRGDAEEGTFWAALAQDWVVAAGQPAAPKAAEVGTRRPRRRRARAAERNIAAEANAAALKEMPAPEHLGPPEISAWLRWTYDA